MSNKSWHIDRHPALILASGRSVAAGPKPGCPFSKEAILQQESADFSRCFRKFPVFPLGFGGFGKTLLSTFPGRWSIFPVLSRQNVRRRERAGELAAGGGGESRGGVAAVGYGALRRSLRGTDAQGGSK